MKSILQTGLAMCLETQQGVCKNMDLEWLYMAPSNLLWVDKVYIPKSMHDLIINEHACDIFDNGKSQELAKVNKLIFEVLSSLGILETLQPNIISQEASDLLYRQIESDLLLLKNLEEANDEDDGHFVRVGDEHYCRPMLWSLYAALLVSQQNDATFLLKDSESDYLKKLWSIKYNGMNLLSTERNEAISNVLTVLFPDLHLGHEFLFDSKEKCEICTRYNLCSDKYLSEIEKQLFYILEQREKEEVRQLCHILDRISSNQINSMSTMDVNELLRELNYEKIRAEKKLAKIFPKVEKWTSLITAVSVPLAFGSLWDKDMLTILGTAGFGLSQAIDKISSRLKDNYRWVGFLNKH